MVRGHYSAADSGSNVDDVVKRVVVTVMMVVVILVVVMVLVMVEVVMVEMEMVLMIINMKMLMILEGSQHVYIQTMSFLIKSEFRTF